MTTAVDAAVYRDGYDDPGYDGPVIAPEWRRIETLATVERFDFTRQRFQAASAAAEESK